MRFPISDQYQLWHLLATIRPWHTDGRTDRRTDDHRIIDAYSKLYSVLFTVNAFGVHRAHAH